MSQIENIRRKEEIFEGIEGEIIEFKKVLREDSQKTNQLACKSVPNKKNAVNNNSLKLLMKFNKVLHKTFRLQAKNKSLDKNFQDRRLFPTTARLLKFLTLFVAISSSFHHVGYTQAQAFSTSATTTSTSPDPSPSDQSPQASSTPSTCFGGLQTFEKISMSSFENPTPAGGSSSSSSFGSGILVQQDDQALTSECVNLCRSQSNCLSFVIDYNKFECKSYATTQQELQQEFDSRYQAARSVNVSVSNSNGTDQNGSYQASASNVHFQHLLPSTSSNYFEKICLDGVANRNQFSDVCGQGRLWTIERVVDTFLDGYVEKEVTNVNNKDECSKLCIFEGQFVCRSADYDQQARLCRLSKEDRRTQPQALRYVPGSNRQYLENQCATPGPSSCVYETKKNFGIISMDALKFSQNVQDCQMKCNQETTFNCRSYSFHQQRCFLSGDDSSSLNSNLIKLPVKQGWQFGEKKCLVELCTKGIFSYEKITGYTLRSALSTPIDLMMQGGSSLSSMMMFGEYNADNAEGLQYESSQERMRHFLPMYHQSPSKMNPRVFNSTSDLVSTMMTIAANSNDHRHFTDPLTESASSRHSRNANNLAITNHCRHSCDLGYLNCPAFTIDYRNNRCQRLDRNSQGRHHELVARDGFAYYEKICLRVPEIMTMCQDKYWIFERVIGYELAPRFYDKSLKFVQSRRDCEEYCLEEKQFQCRSALYNDETSDCKLSRYDRRLANQEGGYYRNFNVRISFLENQCVRDHNQVSEKKQLQCYYEQAKDEPSYPTFSEHIEMVPPPANNVLGGERESSMFDSNRTISSKYGAAYCEQICNENSKFECHSFGYYSSTAQCFLSGDDFTSAGEMAATPSTGFTYFEKKCRFSSENITTSGEANAVTLQPPTTNEVNNLNPYFQPPRSSTSSPITINSSSENYDNAYTEVPRPFAKPPKPHPVADVNNNETTSIEPNQYKCGAGHSFVYQRISGFEPIGGYLTILIKNNDNPGIVAECAELCKRAYECRAFVVDYNSNQCFAMLENSAVGMLSLRQTLGKDYFEGFCVADYILLAGSNCANKTWAMDKIVDQAVVGVQHQKIIMDTDRVQCRQACLEERLFWCKSALFDSATGDCKLYSIDRESMPQMRLVFTKGVDFYENQCQIVTNSCPYDAIERDMTIISVTKSVQARSTFDCEHSCNNEISFNCRSYTYLDQYPSLPNMCLLSSDSRSTSQKGSVRERQRTLYAERNCYYRRPRFPGSNQSGGTSRQPESNYNLAAHALEDPYKLSPRPNSGHASLDNYAPLPAPPRTMLEPAMPAAPSGQIEGSGLSLGQGCELHQYTFERTFGYDYRLGQKERASIAPTIGISIGCQQECLRRGDRCQSFTVEYGLPYQSCFLIDSQVGANKKLLVKAANVAYFEKVCLPRTGAIDPDSLTHSQLMAANAANMPNVDLQSMDIAPSYSSEPWSPQVPHPHHNVNQLPYYLQQQQLLQNYPTRTCAKLWSFERFVNHNFTIQSDKLFDNTLTKALCEMHCLNEASFSCRSATFDYANQVCRLFKNTRRTIMSQFVDLESPNSAPPVPMATGGATQPGTAHVLNAGEVETLSSAASSAISSADSGRRQRQLTAGTAEPLVPGKNIDYLENTCTPEPSSCQYRQLYDLFSPYIDKINHAVSLSDCQRQCDLERLFSCKSINYEPSSKNCMLINEDLISLNRGQQASLLPKKGTIYSEKGNCEMISVQCNSHEMLVSINFDSPFRGRVMAKGNPEQCFLIGDGQTSLQFPIVFGPKCNSRQEGHNTFVNEVVIQQHPVIMTDSDKTVRVMCAFEAPDQTITLKNPSSRDNKTGIDVGTPETSRTRHDKQQFNSIVSNKAAPPSVLLRILDLNGRDASMINLGDDLMLKIQMQMDNQHNSALGIFARNLAARSSNGESLLLIDNDGCPVDHQVFPALEVDPKDGKSLVSSFKAFRFPSSGLVNFEVQIKFCPERCQPVECSKGSQRMRSYGRRKKREASGDVDEFSRLNSRSILPIIQSVNRDQELDKIDSLSTVMKPGKAFQYVRELLLPNARPSDKTTDLSLREPTSATNNNQEFLEEPVTTTPLSGPFTTTEINQFFEGQPQKEQTDSEEMKNQDKLDQQTIVINQNVHVVEGTNADQTQLELLHKPILMHVDEKVVPNTSFLHTRGLNHHNVAPYGRLPIPGLEIHLKRPQTVTMSENSTPSEAPLNDQNSLEEMKPSISGENSRNATDESASSQNESSSEDTTTSLKSDASLKPETTNNINSSGSNEKDVPLRFSILVGENQQNSGNNWAPSNAPSVLVMNSTKVDLDHIVVPGKDGQLSEDQSNKKNKVEPSSSSSSQDQGNQLINQLDGESKGQNDLTFDAQPSNSIAAEVNLNQHQSEKVNHYNHLGLSSSATSSVSQSAASHNCREFAGSSRLWTIIWTGTIVIALNICLVVLSLILYFKKVHLRQNHTIVRDTSECGTHTSNSRNRNRWPSVLLKSKNNLGTSLNQHEHFFCKLNSKPNEVSNVNGLRNQYEFNWPNLSSSSTHSTVSSVASPQLSTSIVRINQSRSYKPNMFDTQSSLRNGNFITGHKSILDMNSYDATEAHASYTNNVHESHPDNFDSLR